MISESIRRLTKDAAVPQKQLDREAIERDVAAYLASGGRIHRVHSGMNVNPNWSPKQHSTLNHG